MTFSPTTFTLHVPGMGRFVSTFARFYVPQSSITLQFNNPQGGVNNQSHLAVLFIFNVEMIKKATDHRTVK